MTAEAVTNKHGAAMLNGDVRDLAGIRHDYDFPAYVKTITLGTTLGCFKTISANQSVTIGDVTIDPGDLIAGDIDSVVCVPQVVAAEALAPAQSIDNHELEQAKLIIRSGSPREDLTRYGRIQPFYAAISQSGRW